MLQATLLGIQMCHHDLAITRVGHMLRATHGHLWPNAVFRQRPCEKCKGKRRYPASDAKCRELGCKRTEWLHI